MAGETNQDSVTNTFPSVAEVIGGQSFDTFRDRDVYFLRGIHDRYSAYWPELLSANITLNDYVLNPEKLQKFVEELGDAMRDRNDSLACSNLALITGSPDFYADANNYRPEILQAAARALIKIGPFGRQALAACFSVDHYRADSGSLGDLAEVVGQERPADPEFITALAATAFTFTTTNGSFFPQCTTAAVKSLLCLNNGLSAVQGHLKIEEVLDNPSRFQAVVDGIGTGHGDVLTTNLTEIQGEIRQKLVALAGSPGGYRDDLQQLDAGIQRKLTDFRHRR